MKKLLVFLLTTATAIAASVGFVWEYPPTELPRIREFRMYTTNGVVGSSTNLTFRASFPAGEHRVWVTAVSTNGIESDPSNIVSFWVPRAVTNIAIIVTQ